MNMQYRKIPRGEERVSVIGFGTGSIHLGGRDEAEATVALALDRGINFFDMAASDALAYEVCGRAFEDRRDKVLIQTHFGAVYDGGKYGWTRDLGKIQTAFESHLKALRTNYTDFGFVHCTDELSDYEQVMSGGIWDFMKELKAEGRVRRLGLSSHNPQVVSRFLETGLIDMVMFSINPAYDYSTGEYAMGSSDARARLYRECEKEGVGISVMKPFSGGQLLSAATSPFKRALTETQCLQYALDRPAVLTVLPGMRDRKDLLRVLEYLEAGAAERDYSVIGEFTPPEAEGTCVYCNHCQPCPQGIDVGLVNKYYDLARAGDLLAKGHYEKLSVKAGDCLRCGHCESRCPFHVKQEDRMAEIARYFG